jgi:DNA-binding response OmpR family regulator
VRDSILVVDDDTRLATALVMRLRAAGYNAAHAACGRAGILCAEQMRPSAIVLDIRLPDMEGFQVCESIRKIPSLHDTPIVFVSANSTQSHRARANAAGGTAFFAKPCPASLLLETIRRLCDARQEASAATGSSEQPSGRESVADPNQTTRTRSSFNVQQP